MLDQRLAECIHCFIQRKAADPNRFSNRGGALLKESKDRAKLQKLLPKVQHVCAYRFHYNWYHSLTSLTYTEITGRIINVHMFCSCNRVHLQLEEELRSRVEAWEKSEGVPFLVRGQNVMEFISNQWEEHRSQKDKGKTDRVSD